MAYTNKTLKAARDAADNEWPTPPLAARAMARAIPAARLAGKSVLMPCNDAGGTFERAMREAHPTARITAHKAGERWQAANFGAYDMVVTNPPFSGLREWMAALRVARDYLSVVPPTALRHLPPGRLPYCRNLRGLWKRGAKEVELRDAPVGVISSVPLNPFYLPFATAARPREPDDWYMVDGRRVPYFHGVADMTGVDEAVVPVSRPFAQCLDGWDVALNWDPCRNSPVPESGARHFQRLYVTRRKPQEYDRRG